ncbi:hypothetical protein Tco_1303325 [Tanacetum coccineum]
MTKVIKGEFEKLDSVKISDVLLTCNTSHEIFNEEFNRMSRMEDDLFTYEVEITEVTNIPCELKKKENPEQQMSHESDDDMEYDPSDVEFTERCSIYANSMDLNEPLLNFFLNGYAVLGKKVRYAVSNGSGYAAQIRRIFPNGYSILVVRTVIFKCLRLSSRMQSEDFCILPRIFVSWQGVYTNAAMAVFLALQLVYHVYEPSLRPAGV